MSQLRDFSSGYVDVPGGRLYYEMAGEGEALVLLHAGIADRRMWARQFETFARDFRVIIYDARGFGRSESEDISFSNRADLAALLDAHDIPKAHVLGNSRGGQIALDFALEYPNRVASLVLVAAGVGGFEPAPGETPALETEMFSRMEALWEAGDLEQLNELEIQMFVDGPGQSQTRVDPQIRRQVLEMNADNFQHMQQEDVKPIPLDPPAIQRLHELQIPVLVMIGDLDESVGRAMADMLEESISGAQKVVFHDVAHMISLEKPEAFNESVLEFLRAN